MTTAAEIRNEIAELDREFNSPENVKSGKLKLHAYTERLVSLRGRLEDAERVERAEAAASKPAAVSKRRPAYIMPTDKAARLERINRALDRARDAGDDEAFRDAYDDDELGELLSYHELATIDRMAGGVSIYASVLGARIEVTHRTIEYAGMQRKALASRINDLEARAASADERVAEATAPLLARIEELEQRLEKSITADDARLMLAAETSEFELSIERRMGDIAQRLVDAIPRPQDGKDGFTVDDFSLSLNGRTFAVEMRCGDRVVTKEAKLPIPVYRGVYRPGTRAEKSDAWTFGGSLWIALRDTDTKPPSADWQLAVRRGTDGKDLR